MSVLKTSIFVLCFGLILGSPSWGMDKSEQDKDRYILNYYQKQAEKVLPEKDEPFQYADIETIFSPILCREAKDFFKKCFSIMFSPEFPQPKHSNKVIIKGYQCLYAKMLDASTLKDQEEMKNAQLEALHQLFAFHKKEITKHNPELGDKIPPFPCKNCLETANLEYEIPR